MGTDIRCTHGCKMFAQGKKTAGNQGNHQHDQTLLAKKLWLVYMGIKQKKKSKSNKL